MNNTKINLSDDYKRAENRTKGITAATPRNDTTKTVTASINPTKPATTVQSVSKQKASTYLTPAKDVSAVPKTDVPKAAVPQNKTGYQTLDKINEGGQILGYKQQYEQGQNAFHQSDTAKTLTSEADTVRRENNLSDEKFGSGVTSKELYETYEKVYELGNIKKEFEEKNALDPNFASSAEGIALSNRANEIRAKYGLSDGEYGAGATSADVLGKAGAIKQVHDIKNEYENYYSNTPEAQSLRKNADNVRAQYGLSDENFGSGVTSQDVVRYLQKMSASPEYQRDVAYKNYADTNRQLNEQMATELSDEVKMRAILDRVQAQKIAENMLEPQLQKEIDDRLAYEDELAAQRGSYGQLSYGKRRAIAEERMKDSKAARILNLVNSLIEEDRQKAEAEYQQTLANKENRLNAINQRIGQNQADFTLGQQYRNEIAQEEAAQQQAIYDGIKAQYDQAFEMSNALGYITPELSAITGIEAGTPMFKMVEYYGDMEKFYAELELDAQRVAIEQYNATKPRYSYNGYNGYNNNNSGNGTLTWNQAKAAFETFSTEFVKENGKKPGTSDIINFVRHSGYSDDDQEQILMAVGVTPNHINDYIAAYQDPRDNEGRIVNR